MIVFDADVARGDDFMIAAWNLPLDGLLARYDGRLLVLIARHVGFDVSTKKSDVGIHNRSIAMTIACIATRLWAKMLAAVFDPRARLHAVDRSMKHV